MKKILYAAIFLSMVLVSSLAHAGVPGLPNQFYGPLTYNGASAPDGVTVTALIGDEEVAECTAKDGIYSLIVTDPDSRNSGKELSFRVNGIDTGTTAIFCSGCIKDVPLSVTGPALTTPDDSDSSDSSSKSSGGSTSGAPTQTSSETTETTAEESDDSEEEIQDDVDPATETDELTCVEKWICTDWTGCDDGIRTRKCADKNECGTEDNRPFESEPCSEAESQNLDQSADETPTGFAAFAESKRLQAVGMGGIVALILFVMFRYSRSQESKTPSGDDESPHRKAGLVTSKRSKKDTPEIPEAPAPPKKRNTRILKVDS